ncbi:MAG: hypothetical protein U1F43_30835 [Myxococcota bacterium]
MRRLGGVHLGDQRLEVGIDLGVARPAVEVARAEAVLPGEARQRLGVERHQRRHERALLAAETSTCATMPAVAEAERVLDGARRHRATVGHDDDVALPAGDDDVAVVLARQVAGRESTLTMKRRRWPFRSRLAQESYFRVSSASRQ